MIDRFQRWLKKDSVIRKPQTIIGSLLGIGLLLALNHLVLEEWLTVLVITLLSIHVVLHMVMAIILIIVVILAMYTFEKAKGAGVDPEIKNPEFLTATRWIDAAATSAYTVLLFMNTLYWQGIVLLIAMLIAQFGLYLGRRTMHELMMNKMKAI